MSSQILFQHPAATLLYHRTRIKQIKQSAAYAGAMADHYERLYKKRSVGPVHNLCRAAFAWFKWKHYEAEYLRLTVKETLQTIPGIKSTSI